MNNTPIKEPLQKEYEQFIEKKIAEQKEQNKQPQIINKKVFMAKQTAPFSIAIDKAINDNKQGFLEYDEKGQYTQSALVVYDRKGKDKTEILFKRFFEDMDDKTFQEFQKASKIITRDSGAYNIFAKKIKHIFEGALFEQYANNGNVPIAIKDKELANMLGKPQSYISANMPNILDSLSNIQIKSYKIKKRSKLESFEKVNIIEAVKHEKGVSYLLFSQLYSYYLSQWGFTQYPKELLKTNDKKYQLAFDIGSYICEMMYQNRTKIKIKSIYERVTSIPRYEDVRDKQNRKYQEKIYKPFEDNIEYLNTFDTFHIDFENTDYINNKDKIDFDKWLDTNLIVTWNIKPNYTNLEKGRKKQQKKIEKAKQRNLEKELKNKKD